MNLLSTHTFVAHSPLRSALERDAGFLERIDMLLPTIRPRNDRLIQSILHQVSLRHASRSAKLTKKTLKPTSSSSSGHGPAVKKADRAAATPSNASTVVASDVASTSAGEAAVAEHFVKEKVIYELSPDTNVVNARLLLGFGLMFCIFVSCRRSPLR
jgi:hypothetical protein